MDTRRKQPDMSAWYTTREKVKDSLEIAHTPRVSRLIAPKIRAATLSVENQMHRRFYPELRTIRIDYPNNDYSPTWRVDLGDNELVTKTGLIIQSGAVTLDNDDLILRRGDNKDEPPYTFIELLQNTNASFGQGDIWQQDITITGLFGYRNDTEVGGELASNINSSVTTVDISPVNGYMSVETGSLLLVGSERMLVRERRSVDTTINISANIDDHANDTTIPVSDGTVFAINEVILINSERMQIIDIAGNNLIVERQFDGTVLGAHTNGNDVYAQRRFTVERGVLGTTAAAHTSGDDVSVFIYPGLIEELATAEAIVMLEQATGAYATTRGDGTERTTREAPGVGLPDLRERAWVAHARKSRISAI